MMPALVVLQRQCERGEQGPDQKYTPGSLVIALEVPGPPAGNPGWPNLLAITKAGLKGRRAGCSLYPALQGPGPLCLQRLRPGVEGGEELLSLVTRASLAHTAHQHTGRLPRAPLPATHLSSKNIKAKAPRSVCVPPSASGQAEPFSQRTGHGARRTHAAGTQCSSEPSWDRPALSPETQVVSAAPFLRCNSTPSLECSLYQTLK